MPSIIHINGALHVVSSGQSIDIRLATPYYTNNAQVHKPPHKHHSHNVHLRPVRVTRRGSVIKS